MHVDELDLREKQESRVASRFPTSAPEDAFTEMEMGGLGPVCVVIWTSLI